VPRRAGRRHVSQAFAIGSVILLPVGAGECSLSVTAVSAWYGPGLGGGVGRAQVLAVVAAAGPPSRRAGLSARAVRPGPVHGWGFGAEECLDEGCQVSGLGDQVKVAAVVDGQLASRDQAVQDPRV
jgi:hypothetical protein